MAGVNSQPFPHGKKTLVLCFDGTGNKFSGTASDSNVVKIYSLLDREDPLQFHYYQPGIGTYVETSSLSRKSRLGRIKSWYIKAKDQAIGTSFAEHVMAGYKFLMRYYATGDDIYFFGFSRGAYTARFLAQMLDYIGLLSPGNEELLRFAWKTFARWQMRTDESEKDKKKKHETFNFMRKFRETFSRPIERIAFIGLFDCVNSVSQFESAWMSRTKFPYTAKTTAKVIRHAVSIDERRAKFRQDLVSETRHGIDEHALSMRAQLHHLMHHEDKEDLSEGPPPKLKRAPTSLQRFRPRARHQQTLAPISSAASQISIDSTAAVREKHKHEHTDDEHQDILEVWFAGQHGDIGGGWPVVGDERPASDLPLLWMIREARRAGLPVDETKLENFFKKAAPETTAVPGLTVEGAPVPERDLYGVISPEESEHLASKTRIHDSLRFGGGLSWMAVLSWQILEHTMVRRYDMMPDGSWKPISWPLPRGESRDMPDEALVHCSVLTRMKLDPKYRPGNLIIGGGGRVARIAPEHFGTGQWEIAHEQGDLLGEAVVRIKRAKTEESSTDGARSKKSSQA